MKVNLGCGSAYLDGWVNVDAREDVRADFHLDAQGFISEHGHETEELYMGHFLEHLMPRDALGLLRTVVEGLPEGAVVSAVAPDIRQVFRAYDAGSVGNRELNEWYIYSYIQPSHHLWCHDEFSLEDLFSRAGLVDVAPIDPATWPPVWHKVGPGARFQCGVKGTVPDKSTPLPELDSDGSFSDLTAEAAGAIAGGRTLVDHGLVEELQEQVDRLLSMVVVEAELRSAAEAEADRIRSSRSFRSMLVIAATVRRALPEGSGRARVAGTLMRSLNGSPGARTHR
jgi:predicted SAM-dependent methyltransferase